MLMKQASSYLKSPKQIFVQRILKSFGRVSAQHLYKILYNWVCKKKLTGYEMHQELSFGEIATW